MDTAVPTARTHSDHQGRNGSAARGVNHGEKTEEVAFPRPGEKQSGRERRRDGPVQQSQSLPQQQRRRQRQRTAAEAGGRVWEERPELQDLLVSWDHLSTLGSAQKIRIRGEQRKVRLSHPP